MSSIGTTPGFSALNARHLAGNKESGNAFLARTHRAEAGRQAMPENHYNILFLSNRNTIRSLFAEAATNRLG
jgi:hypothetical protein